MQENIAGIRKNYSQKGLLEKDALADPIDQFQQWWNDAVTAGIDEVNAMTLATASLDAVPSARIVLLKNFSDKGFVFFTNYDSYKGQQLSENPKACLVFFWKELERQVRITGLVMKLNATESDLYFYSRPIGSQIAAVLSPQSQVVENKEWLDQKYQQVQKNLKTGDIRRPDHWGGYIVKPVIIEFWQGGNNRLHDRLQYSLDENGKWKIERLAP